MTDRSLAGVAASSASSAPSAVGVAPPKTGAPRAVVRAPRLSKDAFRRQKAAVEADLTRLGLRRNHLELALGDPAVQASFVELRRVTSELADVERALSAAEDAWLVLQERAPEGAS